MFSYSIFAGYIMGDALFGWNYRQTNRFLSCWSFLDGLLQELLTGILCFVFGFFLHSCWDKYLRTQGEIPNINTVRTMVIIMCIFFVSSLKYFYVVFVFHTWYVYGVLSELTTTPVFLRQKNGITQFYIFSFLHS